MDEIDLEDTKDVKIILLGKMELEKPV